MCGEQRQRNAQIHYLESQKQGKNIHPFFQHNIDRQTLLSVHKLWCLDLVDSDLVDCRNLVDHFCCLIIDRNGQIL